MRPWLGAIVLGSLALACNGVLGIPEATRLDGAADAGPIPGDDDDTSPCGTNQKQCGDKCVGNADPATGCANAGCNPCPGDNATFACNAGQCAVQTCADGFKDCDGKPETGCEIDLKNDRDNCSECGHVCGATLGCQNSLCFCTDDDSCGPHGNCDTNSGRCACDNGNCSLGSSCNDDGNCVF